MQATLTFNLPEDDAEHKHAINAVSYFSCLWDIDQQMRSALKHGHSFKTADELAEHIRDVIRDSIDLSL